MTRYYAEVETVPGLANRLFGTRYWVSVYEDRPEGPNRFITGRHVWRRSKARAAAWRALDDEARAQMARETRVRFSL